MTNYAVYLTTHSDSGRAEGWVSIDAESAKDAMEKINNLCNDGSPWWERQYTQFCIEEELVGKILDSSGNSPTVLHILEMFPQSAHSVNSEL